MRAVPPPAPAADDRGARTDPVLVAGGGPVGLCAALALARSGVPSVVLEAGPDPRTDPARAAGSKAICFQRDVLDVFDRLGAAGPLLAEGTTWTTARTYYRGREVRTVTFPDTPGTPGRLPPWINISQARVERELLRAALRSPLVRLVHGHRVAGLRQDAGGVVAATESADGPAEWRGSHLVAADGPRSTVRHLLGIGFPGHSFADRFLICDIRADLPFPNERRFYFDPDWNPGRQVLVHQCPDSTWRIDWQVPEDYDAEAERASGELDRRIRKVVGDRPYTVVWSSVYRFHQRCADRLRAGRVLLAGDAAHLYAPFGARGLNSGVHDAENLAWKVAAARRVEAADRGAAEVLLESYHAERWAAAQENLRVTGATMRFLVPHGEAERRLRRETLERALTDPRARERIDSGKLAEPFWYTGSPLTTPRPGAEPVPGEPGRARPPVPGVICPDAGCRAPGTGEPTRLRRLLGPGFTVLVPDTAAVGPVTAATAGLPAPVAVLALSDLDTPDGAVAAALRCAGTAHVVRPDAHLCAVVPAGDGAAVRAAIRRACGAGPEAAAGTPGAERAHRPAGPER
ncbi:pentachlorophenol monooxygenase/3-(3-hydroxy-phenyl)propionate hydroxylase [Streptomonospora nanhaiensis]|uniref:Pentachlorophenol monooxygenase/3-(3-hydroxy-phenyl)propionate hydroxylase n=1 Tax=Streptomonospora nanhaiensis TaxID=1323731 RepID=A0A853BM37_9ACTN|nr:FAD-dependent monooxygenase [Streptomonospora nanhaiensis]NYI95572.1 pentachlorophenol monooxygenase/3-(3-hydroxy-phenyl)propionate hydroxylase [Streptomonospora nanhaiensis]